MLGRAKYKLGKVEHLEAMFQNVLNNTSSPSPDIANIWAPPLGVISPKLLRFNHSAQNTASIN